jgi:hypothetical protein
LVGIGKICGFPIDAGGQMTIPEPFTSFRKSELNEVQQRVHSRVGNVLIRFQIRRRCERRTRITPLLPPNRQVMVDWVHARFSDIGISLQVPISVEQKGRLYDLPLGLPRPSSRAWEDTEQPSEAFGKAGWQVYPRNGEKMMQHFRPASIYAPEHARRLELMSEEGLQPLGF